MRGWDPKLRNLGIFNTRQAAAAGVAKSTLAWLLSQGQIRRIGHDCYHHKDFDVPAEHAQYIAACFKFGPDCYIGGATALFHYQVIDEMIGQIWVVCSASKRTRDPLYRLIRTPADKDLGLEVNPYFKFASIERALLDAFYFEKKIGGLVMAIGAARTALRQNLTSQAALLSLSTRLGWNKRILKHWEAITSE